MSVPEKYQGLKIGRKLAQAAIKQFEQSDVPNLYLETNSKLKPAIKLYESLGFVHKGIKPGTHYKRADVYMVFQPNNNNT